MRCLMVAVWVMPSSVLHPLRHLTFGDATASTPLLHESPRTISRTSNSEVLRRHRALIVVVEGRERASSRTRAVAPWRNSSASRARPRRRVQFLARRHRASDQHDVLRYAAALGRRPRGDPKISSLFFYYFAGAPPSETSRYLDPSYSVAHVTFFCSNHQGDNVARIIDAARVYGAEANPIDKVDFRLAGGLDRRHGAANEEIVKNDILMNVLGFGTIFLLVTVHLPFVRGCPHDDDPALPRQRRDQRLHGVPQHRHQPPVATDGDGRRRIRHRLRLYIVSRAIEEFPKVMARLKDQRKNATEEALTTEATSRLCASAWPQPGRQSRLPPSRSCHGHPLIGASQYPLLLGNGLAPGAVDGY